MNATKMVALLGRPLTPIETTNFDLYFKIAKESLGTLICSDLCSDDISKVYDVREGYRTVFTDIFNDVDEVKMDGTVVEPSKYSIRQWNKRSGSWYNSVVFNERFESCDKEVEVTASWGFETIPVDLQSVLAGLFDLITKKNKFDSTIQAKQIEDFKISFRTDVDLDESFYDEHSKTLNKYSMCDIADVQHGKVC